MAMASRCKVGNGPWILFRSLEKEPWDCFRSRLLYIYIMCLSIKKTSIYLHMVMDFFQFRGMEIFHSGSNPDKLYFSTRGNFPKERNVLKKLYRWAISFFGLLSGVNPRGGGPSLIFPNVS